MEVGAIPVQEASTVGLSPCPVSLVSVHRSMDLDSCQDPRSSWWCLSLVCLSSYTPLSETCGSHVQWRLRQGLGDSCPKLPSPRALTHAVLNVFPPLTSPLNHLRFGFPTSQIGLLSIRMPVKLSCSAELTGKMEIEGKPSAVPVWMMSLHHQLSCALW